MVDKWLTRSLPATMYGALPAFARHPKYYPRNVHYAVDPTPVTAAIARNRRQYCLNAAPATPNITIMTVGASPIKWLPGSLFWAAAGFYGQALDFIGKRPCMGKADAGNSEKHHDITTRSDACHAHTEPT
uniref:Uncharacterized protein n=1 Tax=mine drainage metagenome TaxID=410659 RepID=E6Q2T7_9ZZZZ